MVLKIFSTEADAGREGTAKKLVIAQLISYAARILDKSAEY